MSEKTYWIVLQVETGLIDGWFTSDEEAQAALENWDEDQPRFRHLKAQVFIPEGDAPIWPSDRWLRPKLNRGP